MNLLKKNKYFFIFTLILTTFLFLFRQEEGEVVGEDGKIYFFVKRVVDGDTFDVVIGGKTETVRMIGINTPETVDPRKPVECFGKEASKKAKDLLENKRVYLEPDSTQSDRDRYQRLLRYVFLKDGTLVNNRLIQEGYAYEYTYDTPYKYQDEFKNAQKSAEEQAVGLWSDNACR